MPFLIFSCRAGNTLEHYPKLSRLGALVCMALRAEENWLSSMFDPIHGLLVVKMSLHWTTARLSSVWDLHSCLWIHFCIHKPSWANLSQVSVPRLGFTLRCIPGLNNTGCHIKNTTLSLNTNQFCGCEFGLVSTALTPTLDILALNLVELCGSEDCHYFKYHNVLEIMFKIS